MRVIGIDAGGTKTVGLLADGDGRVLAEARDAGANLQTHGELGVEKVIDSLLERLTGGGSVDALCLGIAGVDRLEDEAVVRGILRRLGHRDRARVVKSLDSQLGLDANAIEAVKQWVFEPGTLQGQPVAVVVQLTLEFRLH